MHIAYSTLFAANKSSLNGVCVSYLSLKLVVVLKHEWQIKQKAKLGAKKSQIKAKQTEIKPEKE